MRIRKMLFVFMVLIAGAGSVAAATPQEAAGFIDGMIGQALDTVRDQSLSDEARIQRFDAMLHRDFDLPRIARYVLGRYWAQTSEADRAAFADLFERWVVRSYGSRLAKFSGETVKVTGARAVGEGGAVVASEIEHSSGGPPTKLDWRVADSDGRLKVLDVTVAGVSMALTEREEISSSIQRSGGTVAALNRDLATRLNGTASASR